MSYILDALRRAEAERERGNVPGLHSPGLPMAGAPPLLPAGGARAGGRARATAPPALWVAGALALALLGVAAGMWWTRAAEPGLGSAPGVSAATAPRPAPGGGPTADGTAPEPPRAAGASARLDAAAVPLLLPTPPVAVTGAVTAAARPAPADVTASPPTGLPEAQVPAAPRAGTTEGKVAPAVPAAARTTLPTAAPTTAPTAQASTPSIPLAALAPEQRAAWPPLVIGGSIYSDSPASRFIIANGQVVREGETAAPGVVVQRIGRGNVLLLWRDLRVEVPL